MHRACPIFSGAFRGKLTRGRGPALGQKIEQPLLLTLTDPLWSILTQSLTVCSKPKLTLDNYNLPFKSIEAV